MLALLRAEPRLLPIVLVVFCVMIGMGMMVPVLPLLAGQFGGGPAAAGFLISAFGGARLISSVPAGLAADRFGRRAAMVAGTVILALASFGAAGSGTLSGFAVWLFLQGIGSGIYVTAALAAMADLSEPQNRGRVMSLYQGALLMGVSLGPALGGLAAASFGIMAPFLVQGSLAALGALSAAIAVRETRRGLVGLRLGQPGRPTAPSRWRALRRAAFLAVCLVTFGTFFSRTTSNWQLLPIMAQERFGFGFGTIGLLLTTGALANLAVLPLAGAGVDRFGGGPMIALGSLATVLALLVLALGQVEATLWAGIALIGAAGGVLGPACAAYALEVSTAEHGATMGTLRMAGDAGLVIGPPLLGSLMTLTGLESAEGFEITAALVAVIGVVFWLTARPRKGAG